MLSLMMFEMFSLMNHHSRDEFLARFTNSRNVARLAGQKRYHGRFAFWLCPHWANLPKKAETQIASQAGMRLPFSHQKQHTSSSGGVVAKGFFNHHEQQRFEPLVIQNPTYPG